ncbi:hypothetical protein [Pseudoalteromonas rhizosphaerae]|uniref:hypothetical protein n=1 Tax=Pseudoalteromonas rhizosphaerae TaxID=2518973 RepID=UPI002147DD41|nr:hypothetical protein [Pseudoalteromonas rhizosphaerae]
MRELSQAEFDSRSNAIFGGNNEDIEVISVSGSFLPYTAEWAAYMYSMNDRLANSSTMIDVGNLDIDVTLDSDGDYSIDSFIEDIKDMTADEKAQFSKALADLSTVIGGVVESAIANGADISPQTLDRLSNLGKGIGAIGTAIDAGLIATKFSNGDYSTGTIADALNIVATVAVGTALGGPVGFAAAFATALFGDEVIEFALDAAVSAGQLTVEQYNEVVNNIALSMDSSGMDFGDIEYWKALFAIPDVGIGGGWSE